MKQIFNVSQRFFSFLVPFFLFLISAFETRKEKMNKSKRLRDYFVIINDKTSDIYKADFA